MIQPATSQFLVNSRSAKSDDDASRGPDRQRGMWSFLTWSFFLAQAVAAHEAYAKGVGMGEGDADGDASGGGDGGASKAGFGPASALGVSGCDIDPTAAAQLAAAVAAGLLSPDVLEAMQADPAQFEAFMKALLGDGTGDVAAAGGAIGDGEQIGEEPTDPSDGGTLPGIILPIDVAVDLGLEVGGSPLLDLGLDANNGLGIHVALNSAPIIDLSLDTSDGLNLDLLGMTVAVGPGGGLGGLLALDGGLGDVPLTSAFDAIYAATGLPTDGLDPVLTSVGSAVEPVLGALGPTTTLLGDVGDAPMIGNILGSGGTILHALGAGQPLNAFFGSGGQHTSYAIELQSTTSLGADGGDSQSTFASADDVPMVLDHVVDSADTTLSSVVENLRGIGDGFA